MKDDERFDVGVREGGPVELAISFKDRPPRWPRVFGSAWNGCTYRACPRCDGCAVCGDFHGFGACVEDCPYRWWHRVRDRLRRWRVRWLGMPAPFRAMRLPRTRKPDFSPPGQSHVTTVAIDTTGADLVNICASCGYHDGHAPNCAMPDAPRVIGHPQD